MPSTPPTELRPPTRDEADGAPHRRDPAEVRAYESRVWDLAKHLVHPAALYVVAQTALWIGLEDNGAFRNPTLGFWTEAAVHVVQFLGAWAVFYGTLLRDMGRPSRTPALLWWFAVLGAAGAWSWPDRQLPSAVSGLRIWLGLQLAAAAIGWVVVMRRWRSERASHLSRAEVSEEAR